MAIDRKIKGMDGAKFYPDARYRLTWDKLPKDKLPKPYEQYWAVSFKGKHVADFFKGKSCYTAVIFGRFTIRRKDGYDLALYLASLFVHPQN